MKKCFIFVLMIISLTDLFSQNRIKNSKYYYWSDAEGSYFFEFFDDTFTLYDFSVDNKNQVPLPDYENELTAIKVYGKYKVVVQNGFSYIVVGTKKYLMLL